MSILAMKIWSMPAKCRGTWSRRKLFLLIPVAMLALFSGTVQAAADTSSNISWTFLIISLFGGLALFLYGMERMSDGLKKSAGNKMRMILAALTNNRVIGLLVGAFVTTVIQSSSATTVMLVSFVQAGLMTSAQSMGVILGADIGTTITAQLVAFKLTDYALMMVAIGFAIRMFSKNDTVKHMGEAILGFGILFLGMKLMGDSMKPLRTFPGFIDTLKGLESPLLGVLVGTIFTAIIQSSSAFSGLVIVLAQQGLISLEAGIPLIFGANIGTCVTAGLASIGATRDAKRVALAHVAFKIAGVLLFIFWIPAFATLIRAMTAGFGGGTARQIANAHTIFNVSLAFIFLPFTVVASKVIHRILPDKKEETGLRPAVWYLDDATLGTPAMAMDLARTEIARMMKILGRMLSAVIHPFTSNEPRVDEIYPKLSLIEGIEMRENKMNFLEHKVKDYMIRISRQEVTDQQAGEIAGLISIVKDMESAADIIHRDILPLVAKKRALESDFSEEGRQELLDYHNKVCKQIGRLKEAFAETDLDRAHRILDKESEYLDLGTKYRSQHFERLLDERESTFQTHEVHMELMDYMKQINVYASNMAKTIVNISYKQ